MQFRFLITLTFCAMACSNNAAGPMPFGAEVGATALLRFEPGSVMIEEGGTVTWNFGTVPHNVVFDAVAGRPGDIAGQNISVSIRRTFTQAGVYPYGCTIHPGMSGRVTVLPKPNSPGYLEAR